MLDWNVLDQNIEHGRQISNGQLPKMTVREFRIFDRSAGIQAFRVDPIWINNQPQFRKSIENLLDQEPLPQPAEKLCSEITFHLQARRSTVTQLNSNVSCETQVEFSLASSANRNNVHFAKQEARVLAKLRLLLLNYEFPPSGGGAGRATYFMARELVRKGHEVEVLTARTDDDASLETLDGIRVHRVRSFRRNVHDAGLLGTLTYLVFALFRLRTLLKNGSYDCAQFYFALPTGLLALYWRVRSDAPYIISLRGSDVPGYDECNNRLQFLHRVLRKVTASILGGAAYVIANSNSLRDLAQESFPDQSIQVITNGICIGTRVPRETVSADSKEVRVLCVARLIERKGVEYLLRAMARDISDRLVLDVVGEGPLMGELRRLADQLGLGTKVEFLGFVYGEALTDKFRDADIFTLPSLSESCSMALLEAMASGLPVVASNVGGIPELVADGENGFLVPPAEPEALRAAIDRLAASPGLRSKFSLANRRKIEGSYTWSCIADAYVKSYLNASDPHAGRMISG